MALVAIAFTNHDDVKHYSLIFIPAFVIVGLLMVSTVKFSKPQAFILNRIHGIQLIILLLIIVALGIVVRKYILLVLIGLIALYIVSGLITMIIQFIQDNKY
jgi:CDP-diacylglycerol--serine O-phosphatidyltransferase